jgi:hypothetical protein
MAVENLLFIGAILSVTLGCLALRFVRRNEKLEWNEKLAAHLICLMFIVKGLQNAAGGYSNTDGSESVWQFWKALMHFLDFYFDISIVMIALVYPVPILRTPRQLKIGYGIMVGVMVVRLLMVMLGRPNTVLELFGMMYVVCGLIWGSVYIKFRMLDETQQNKSTRNIAFVAALFLTLLLGHIWMYTPDMLFLNETFYFIDLWSGTNMTSTMFDYIWQLGHVFGIAVGLAILYVEIKQAINGQASPMLYIIIAYMLSGMLRYLMTSFNSLGEVGLAWNDDFTLLGIWNLLTAGIHFTMVRPLIAMYILLRYGLFDINENNRDMARLMTVMLIVVATSALLELIQTIIPINQMLSAALMGILIAFGVGWEERSFDTMASEPASLREDIDKGWFPTFDIPQRHMDRLIMVSAVYVVLMFFLSFIYWQMNIYEKILEVV